MLNRIILVCGLLLYPVILLTAVESSNSINTQAAWYFPHIEGYGSSGLWVAPDSTRISADELLDSIDNSLDPGRSIGSAWGSAEAKVFYTHRRTYPLLRRPGPLFEANNLQLRITAGLSPVSTDASLQISLTPLALLQLHSGISLGTGWYLLFNGMGRNLPGPQNESVQRDSLQSALFRAWQSASFQFDLAALYPGEWNHLVTQLSARIEYSYLGIADRDTPWQWEADRGQNFNGFSFHGSYFLGYQMPLMVNMVGVLLETSQNLGHNADRSTFKDGGWGSDFVTMTFGPLVNIALNPNHSLAMLVQFRRDIRYTDETAGYRYFEYREADSAFIRLYRIALSYTCNF